jgi:hypothetical protein
METIRYAVTKYDKVNSVTLYLKAILGMKQILWTDITEDGMKFRSLETATSLALAVKEAEPAADIEAIEITTTIKKVA